VGLTRTCGQQLQQQQTCHWDAMRGHFLWHTVQDAREKC
jgi:hypothetical protein